MNNKKTGRSKNRRFQHSGLMFYCYLLIPLNELARKALKINNLKNKKNFIVLSMVSIGNGQKGHICHLDVRRDLMETWSRSLKSDLSQAQDDNHYEENGFSSKLACSFPCYRLIPLNKLRITNLKSICWKMKKNSLLKQCYQKEVVKKGIFNYELRITMDTPLTSWLSGQAIFLEGNLASARLNLW